MKNDDFLNTVFFDISEFKFKELLENATPWDSVAQITQFIAKLFENKIVTGNYKDRQDVYIGEGTTVHESVEIRGPAIIGKNCVIDHAAFLRDGCIIGDNVHIGHAVEVKHTIILNNTMVAHLNYVGDSILGNSVNISGGAILANFRLDKKNISIKTETGKIDTGRQKFSAAIGDNSVVGVNAVINPGTLLGKNTAVYPLTSVFGVHNNNAVIK